MFHSNCGSMNQGHLLRPITDPLADTLNFHQSGLTDERWSLPIHELGSVQKRVVGRQSAIPAQSVQLRCSQSCRPLHWMLDNASLAARRDRIVELYFARRSDALSPRMVTMIESGATNSHSTSSHTRLAARAA